MNNRSVISKETLFYIFLCIALGITGAGFALQPGHIFFPLDDAYITLHNAQVLLSGTDRNFVGVPVLYGVTSLMHLWLVFLISHITEPLTASFIANVLAVMLYACGLARLGFSQGLRPIYISLIVIIGLTWGYTTYQLLNGLETGLAMAAVTWALIFAQKPTYRKHLALLCGVMPFIRPELAILSVILMVRQILQTWYDSPSTRITAILSYILLAAAAAAPCLLHYWINTGEIIPSTIRAKHYFFAEDEWPATEKISTIYHAFLYSGLGVFFITLLLPKYDSLVVCGVLFILAFVAIFFFGSPGMTHHNCYRYDYILLPVPLYALITGLRARPQIGKILLSFLVMINMLLFPFHWDAYWNSLDFTDTELADTAKWAQNHLPPDANILIHDAGYISFATSFHLIDVVGLKTPESITYHKQWTFPSGGLKRDEAINAIALRFMPQYLIVLGGHDDNINGNAANDFWFQCAMALKKHGWQIDLLKRPAKRGYFIYKLSPPA